MRDEWLLIAEDSGPDGNGCVLAYTWFETEEEANQFEGRRGELCDVFGLFIDEDIPDDFTVEVMTYTEFKECYSNRMPLRNYCKLT